MDPNRNYYISITVYTDVTYTALNTNYSPSSQSYYAMNILGLAESSVYLNKMSTAYNSIVGNQELLVWAVERLDRRVHTVAATRPRTEQEPEWLDVRMQRRRGHTVIVRSVDWARRWQDCDQRFARPRFGVPTQL